MNTDRSMQSLGRRVSEEGSSYGEGTVAPGPVLCSEVETGDIKGSCGMASSLGGSRGPDFSGLCELEKDVLWDREPAEFLEYAVMGVGLGEQTGILVLNILEFI